MILEGNNRSACVRGRRDGQRDRTSPRPEMSTGLLGVTLTALGLSLPKSFFIVLDGGEWRSGSWCTMNRCRGCVGQGVAPPRGRRRQQRPVCETDSTSRTLPRPSRQQSSQKHCLATTSPQRVPYAVSYIRTRFAKHVRIHQGSASSGQAAVRAAGHMMKGTQL